MNLDDLNGMFEVSATEATAVVQRGGDVAPLEAGVYEAVAIGSTFRIMENSTEGPKSVMEVVWQVVDGGNKYYLRSKSLTKLNLNNEKSNFFVMMKGIAKLTGPTDPTLKQKMEALGVIKDGFIRPDNLIGLSCRVTTGTQTSARTQKEYPIIIGYSPSKLAENAIVADTVAKGLLQWTEGDTYIVSPLITVKEKTTKTEAPLPTAPAPRQPHGTSSTTEEDFDKIFGK